MLFLIHLCIQHHSPCNQACRRCCAFLCVRIGPNSTHIYIRLHPPKHLPEDERSSSRNVANLKNMIQDKTNCSSESIQHTESTNLNIFRIKQLYSQYKSSQVQLEFSLWLRALHFASFPIHSTICQFIHIFRQRRPPSFFCSLRSFTRPFGLKPTGK